MNSLCIHITEDLTIKYMLYLSFLDFFIIYGNTNYSYNTAILMSYHKMSILNLLPNLKKAKDKMRTDPSEN